MPIEMEKMTQTIDLDNFTGDGTEKDTTINDFTATQFGLTFDGNSSQWVVFNSQEQDTTHPSNSTPNIIINKSIGAEINFTTPVNEVEFNNNLLRGKVTIKALDANGNQVGETVTLYGEQLDTPLDTTAPTLEFDIQKNSLNVFDDSQVITITFTEEPIGFTIDDLRPTNGSLSNLTQDSTNSKIFTVTFTASSNTFGSGKVEINNERFADSSLNLNENSVTSDSFDIDTVVPSIEPILSSKTSLSWGPILNITESSGDGTVSVTTNNVEDGQIVTVRLYEYISWTNVESYTGTVTSNSASVTIPYADLQSLANGGTYIFTADVSRVSGNAADKVTSSSFTVDFTSPTINAITTADFSWGAYLNNTEKAYDGTVSVTTTNVENGQNVTVTLNSKSYTEAVTSNSAVVTIPTLDLSALTNGSYTLTAEVSRVSGNTAQVTSDYFTVDFTAPVITITTGTDSIQLGTTWNDAGAKATDASWTGEVDVTNVTYSSGLTDGGTPGVGDHSVTYQISDASGNTGSATRAVKVVDTTAPVITITTGTDSIPLGTTWNDAGAKATDASWTGEVDVTNVTYSSGLTNGGTPGAGNHSVTYQISDASGNTGSATRPVYVTTPSPTASP